MGSYEVGLMAGCGLRKTASNAVGRALAAGLLSPERIAGLRRAGALRSNLRYLKGLRRGNENIMVGYGMPRQEAAKILRERNTIPVAAGLGDKGPLRAVRRNSPLPDPDALGGDTRVMQLADFAPLRSPAKGLAHQMPLRHPATTKNIIARHELDEIRNTTPAVRAYLRGNLPRSAPTTAFASHVHPRVLLNEARNVQPFPQALGEFRTLRSPAVVASGLVHSRKGVTSMQDMDRLYADAGISVKGRGPIMIPLDVERPKRVPAKSERQAMTIMYGDKYPKNMQEQL